MTGSYGGHDVVVLDYRYQESSTNSNGQSQSQTYRYSIYALGLPCRLPDVSISPEWFLSKIGNLLGVHDIELESEDFNRAFRVTAADRKLAYDLLPGRNMELLLAHGDVHLRVTGTTLLCVDRRWLDVERIEPRLDVMAALLANVPSFVWDDRRPGAAAGEAS